MKQKKELTPKQNLIVKIVGLSLIPLVIWLVYDVNQQYAISEKYGGEFVKNGWIEEKTSCNRLQLQIAMKEGNLFTPSTHIPALKEWLVKMDCDNPDSEYYRDSNYDYDSPMFGTNLQAKQIQFIEFDEWVKQYE